jgi:hypothetical protein
MIDALGAPRFDTDELPGDRLFAPGIVMGLAAASDGGAGSLLFIEGFLSLQSVFVNLCHDCRYCCRLFFFLFFLPRLPALASCFYLDIVACFFFFFLSALAKCFFKSSS